MIGFVLIVVIVMVALLIFLGISIRGGQNLEARESRDIQQFLESSMQYTTECAISFIPAYSDLAGLSEDCLSGARCLDGRDSCEVYEETLTNLIESSWQVGKERPIKAYAFKSVYTTNSSEKRIISLLSGNCTENVIGSEFISPAFPGRIVSSLELCS